MDNNELKMTVPQEIINSIVKTQIVAAIGKSEALIAGVVEAILNHKDSQYDKHTAFEKQTMEVIRTTAVEVFKEWLKENRDKVRSALITQLNVNKKTIVDKMVKSAVDDFSNVHVTMSLNFPRD